MNIVSALPTAAPSREVISAEVRKIMNSVFHQLKSEFQASKSYKGDDIHSKIMNTIKVRPLPIYTSCYVIYTPSDSHQMQVVILLDPGNKPSEKFLFFQKIQDSK